MRFYVLKNRLFFLLLKLPKHWLKVQLHTNIKPTILGLGDICFEDDLPYKTGPMKFNI